MRIDAGTPSLLRLPQQPNAACRYDWILTLKLLSMLCFYAQPCVQSSDSESINRLIVNFDQIGKTVKSKIPPLLYDYLEEVALKSGIQVRGEAASPGWGLLPTGPGAASCVTWLGRELGPPPGASKAWAIST